jgi:hypothetical protein
LRGATLAEYVNSATVSITDMTDFVAAERANASPPFDNLRIPLERVYDAGEFKEFEGQTPNS